jgi:S-DNA-T family DNA segregation ATPase FtsK/SpoIIIE
VQIPRSLPGRGYALTGHGDLTEFQAGYSGNRTAEHGGPVEPVVREFAFGVDATSPERRAERAGETTDLQWLVAAARRAAEDLELATPRSPWLDPLDPIVPLGTLPEPELETADPSAVRGRGLLDEPALQRRRPFAVDLDAAGSLLVFGAGGSGKSTLLRTLAISLAQRSSPEELQVYGLDFATRALSSLEALPHCGHVIAADDEERVERLLAQLRITLEARKELFAKAGVFTLSEYRAAAETGQPRILVLLDGYGGFTDAFFNVRGGELIDAFARLVADGRPLGVHFAISSDRRGAVPNALAAIIPVKVVLRMAEEDEFVALGVDAKAVRGAVLPPGRGFVGGLELQAAILGDDSSAEGSSRRSRTSGTSFAAAGATRGRRSPPASDAGRQLGTRPSHASARGGDRAGEHDPAVRLGRARGAALPGRGPESEREDDGAPGDRGVPARVGLRSFSSTCSLRAGVRSANSGCGLRARRAWRSAAPQRRRLPRSPRRTWAATRSSS